MQRPTGGETAFQVCVDVGLRPSGSAKSDTGGRRELARCDHSIQGRAVDAESCGDFLGGQVKRRALQRVGRYGFGVHSGCSHRRQKAQAAHGLHARAFGLAVGVVRRLLALPVG